MTRTKTTWRRRLCMLFCAILIFSMLMPSAAFAENAVVTTGSMYSYFQTYGSNGVWKDIQTPSHWITSTGEVAYCLQTSKDTPYNASYTTVDGEDYYDEYVLTGLMAIIQNGYPVTNAGFTDEQARYATANAIRFFLAENYADGMPQYLNLNVNGDWIRGKSGYEELYEWALYLVDLARWGAADPGSSGSISFSPSTLTLTEDADGQYFTGNITVNKNTSEEYGLAYNVPDETIITGYTGTRTETLTLKIPTSYANQSYSLCAYGGHDGNVAKLFFWAPAEANQQRIMTYVLENTEDYMEAYATINTPAASPKSGSIQITKTDESGNPLSGVSFELYDEFGNLEGSGQTNSSGIITFSNLELGEYYYRETATLPGYILDSDYYVVMLTTNGQVAKVTVKNSRESANVAVIKTDSKTGAALPGVHFKLVDSGGNTVAEGDTGNDGKLIFPGIPLGSYTLTETATVTGYVLDETARPVMVNTNGQMLEVRVTNDPAAGNLIIVKTDAGSGAPLSGVHFKLTDSTGTVVKEGDTDENGRLSFTFLPLGNYTLTETMTKDGYVLNSTPVSVSLTNNGQTVTKTITNRRARGSVSIVKTDSEAGEALAGVHFELRDEAGALVAEGDTSADGTLSLLNIPVGYYTLRETETVSGYVLDETPHEVNLTENGQVVELSMQNDPIHSTLEIVKKDAHEDVALMGAGYRLYDSSGMQVAEGYTDASGKLAFLNLARGRYSYAEFKAPRGYLLDDTCYPVNISENGITITETRTNERRPGTLVVTKQNTDGSPLEGAAFLLEYSTDQGTTWQPAFYRVGDELTRGGCTTQGLDGGELTTGADGKATFTGLRADGLILYRLTETKAPPGMTLIGDSILVGTLPVESGNTSAEDTEVFDAKAFHYTLNVTATDDPQYRLPEAGGGGFGLFPAAMMLSAVPMIFTIKSKTKKENN